MSKEAKAPSMFGGANSVATVGARNYFNAGDYVVEVLSVTARQGFRGANCVATFRVKDVLMEYDADGAYDASNKVGEVVSVVYNLNPGADRDFHLGRLRQLTEAVLGPVEDLEGVLETATAPPGTAWAGTILRATSTRGVSQRKKTALVNTIFGAAPATSPAAWPSATGAGA